MLGEGTIHEGLAEISTRKGMEQLQVGIGEKLSEGTEHDEKEAFAVYSFSLLGIPVDKLDPAVLFKLFIKSFDLIVDLYAKDGKFWVRCDELQELAYARPRWDA